VSRKLDLRRLLAAASLLATSATVGRASADEPPTFADRSDSELEEAPLRTLGILLDPLAVPEGGFGAEVDVVVHRAFSLGGTTEVVRLGSAPLAAAAAAFLVYPLGSAFEGPYLGPGLAYTRPAGQDVTEVGSAAEALTLTVAMGWQWTWEYGLSLRVGGVGEIPLRGALSHARPSLLQSSWIAFAPSALVGWTW
jgi:hypothetical protein